MVLLTFYLISTKITLPEARRKQVFLKESACKLSNVILEGSQQLYSTKVTGVVFMPPTLEKLKGHIALGLSVRASVHASVTKFIKIQF